VLAISSSAVLQHDAAATYPYALSLHDALPICRDRLVHGQRKAVIGCVFAGLRDGFLAGSGRIGHHLPLRGRAFAGPPEDEAWRRSEEHTSELQSRFDLVCRLLLEKKKRPPLTS